MSAKSDGSEFETKISADPSGLVAAMDKAGRAAAGSAESIKGSFDQVGKTFEAVQGKLMVLAGVVAGGKFFKDAIDASNKLTGEAMNLSKRLGITGAEASALNTALGDIYSDSDTYIGAFDKFAKQLKNNEQGLQAMGLATRDSNGNLRDSNTLFMEALQSVSDYKPGLDQTTAAMTLFGKGVDDVMKLQKLNTQVLDDAKIKNQELGLSLSQEGVAATKAYKAAMNDVGDVMLAVKNAVGQAVMPIFTELGQWFAEGGPAVVNVFKAAMTGLLLVFRGIQMAVKITAAAVFESISLMIDSGKLLGEVFTRLFEGDFGGAVEAAKGIGTRIGAAFGDQYKATVQESLHEAQQAFGNDMNRVWNPTAVNGVAGKSGNKTMGDFGKTNGGSGAGAADKPAKDPSFMAYYEELLAEEKRVQVLLSDGKEYTKDQELGFWRWLLDTAQTTGKDKVAIMKRMADLEVATTIQAAQQKKQIAEGEAAHQERLALSGVDASRTAYETMVQLGTMSQGQLIEIDMAFEQRRTEIRRKALEDRKALIDPERDPVAYAAINNQIEELEVQHQVTMGQMREKMNAEEAKTITGTMNNIQQRWAGLIQQFMQGTMTVRHFMLGLFQAAAQAVVQTMANMVAQWMARKVAMAIFGKATALSEISQAAGKAGAGGVASMAAAPFPMNLGALGFGAAMAAAALAYAPSAAASQGYDIPAFTNPIVQAHAREMILPAKHADVIRALADGDQPGGGGGGGASIHFHGQGGDFIRADQLEGAMRELGHNFAYVRR